MRRFLPLAFLTLALFFNPRTAECALWNLNFQGHITSIGPAGITDEELALLGVTVGSPMWASSIYNSEPEVAWSGTSLVVYSMGSTLFLNFPTFTVRTNDWFYLYDETPYRILYGNPSGGSVRHDSGWVSTVWGGSQIKFVNKTGTPFSFDRFPTELNTDNFDMTFAFGSFNIGGDRPENPLAAVYGVIDTVQATPTPIPGAAWLLGSGLVGLVALRRRLKR